MAARSRTGSAHVSPMRSRVCTAEHGVVPGLAAVLVGEDPASQTYVGMKHRATEAAGMRSQQHLLPTDTSQAELLALIDRLNADETVDGILVQLPLPAGLDAREVQRRVAPEKDVDALNPVTAGCWPTASRRSSPAPRPGSSNCWMRPASSARALRWSSSGVPRSSGVPLSIMLTLKGRDATVTLAHSRTRDLGEVCRRAEVLIVATGQRGLVTADMVRPGAVVIDVGTNRTEDGRLVGDVDFDACRRGRRRDHTGPGWGRADDGDDAAAEHPDRREAPRRGLA
jgi:methylenetetrahydrofolate dehydrogenase (NADP+) / methenyltetrahydrofolate cyclohydrolase